jgi:Flp pilus assembly protein TadB
VFGRSRTTNEELAEQAIAPAREGAKNRPTPKRREQEAARKRPLVETDRKAARTADRAKRREQLAKQRQAMLTGDETHLPPRDKGPVKRFIRDYVDARWGIAEFMLPVMLIVLALSFVRQPWAMLIVFALVYGLIAAAIIDTFLMWRRVKKKLTEKFGESAVQRGDGFYTAMRAFQMRRTRMPRPIVARGDYPT